LSQREPGRDAVIRPRDLRADDSLWPSDGEAANPAVADGMNKRTENRGVAYAQRSDVQNTKLLKGDLAGKFTSETAAGKRDMHPRKRHNVTHLPRRG